jgi:CheY-like chemotaxis protein
MARILCIDDYQVALEAVKLVQEQAGHQVLALRGADAAEAFADASFDAAVLDFRMPLMDGGRIAKRLKEANPGLPIIMLSAYPEDIPEQVADSVDVFLAKGTGTARSLLDVVAELVAKPQTTVPVQPAVHGLRRAAADALQLDSAVADKWEAKG